MIHKIKLELGCGLYQRAGKEQFHKLFMGKYDPEILFECPTNSEPLITTIFWLKQTMWNHIDSMEWKKQ